MSTLRALALADQCDHEDAFEVACARELRRLHSVEKAFQQWITKTEWVQKSLQSHELGIHRADVMKQRLDQLLTENQQLRAALDKPQVEQEPYVWYDIDTGDTWTVGAIADGCSAPDGIIPLYNNPQPPRQPLTDEQINDHRLALAYDSEDLPDPWDFKQGVRAAERAHGIGGDA